MSSALAVSKENFRKEVLESENTVLADFWAAWCGPCRMLSPVIDEIAAENSDIKVVKINVDEQPELAQEFNIMTIPSLLVFKNGELVNQSAGVKPKPLILQMVK